MTPGLIIAGTASGVGKTIATLGIVRALVRRGVAVAAAKIGPDYIDPGFLRAASRRPAYSLDSWAMRADSLADSLGTLSARSELIIAEGVMGLFDGIGTAGSGSTAELALLLGWPVVLVLDARGSSASLAATLSGFARHRSGLELAGYIVNRVGSLDHADVVAAACQEACPWIALIGCLPRAADLELPSRHLGLVQAEERPDLDAFLERAADHAERHLDLDALGAMARPARPPPASFESRNAPLGQRIAVASDEAFAFCYPRLLDGWRAAGAALYPFSPLADEPPDKGADAIYLPGGYPELHAGRLAGNRLFLNGLAQAAKSGTTIYGECGGYMVLGRMLTDAEGIQHKLAGLLPLTTSFAEKRLQLGYRRVTLAADCALGSRGAGFRGHEFHYAAVTGEGPGDKLFEASDALGRRSFAAGQRAGSVMGSFIHLIDRAPDR